MEIFGHGAIVERRATKTAKPAVLPRRPLRDRHGLEHADIHLVFAGQEQCRGESGVTAADHGISQMVSKVKSALAAP